MLLKSKDPDISAALSSCRLHYLYAFGFHAVGNLLLLAFPLFMMNTFRVVETSSTQTLLALLLGFLLAIWFKGIFEWVRSALFVRAGIRIDRRLTARLTAALFRRRAAGRTDSGSQTLRDLESYRQYVVGRGGTALLDAPWSGLFLGILFVLDTLVGVVAVVAMLTMLALEVVKVIATKGDLAISNRVAVASYGSLELNLQSSEAVVGMSMLRRVIERWRTSHDEALSSQARLKTRNAGFDSLITTAQISFQGLIVATAVYQVSQGLAPAGVIFASMLLFNFTVRPVRGMISAWTEFVPVRQGLSRIEDVLASVAPLRPKMAMPRPAGILTVRGVTFVPSGFDRAILRNINFGVEAGLSLGVVGLIGSGKTSLARILVGCQKASAGQVRLDGHDIWDWTQSSANIYIGYLPQAIGLIPASVVENIGRFGEFDEAAVLDAAQIAGAHDIIVKLPRGYDTVIGEGGHPLSGGQRQLIGLARAAVGHPSLVVLDEPNSNLDGPGEEALMGCIRQLKARGTTIVMISHRPSLVRQLDKVVLLKDGELVGFGDTDSVYKRLGRPTVVKQTNAG